METEVSQLKMKLLQKQQQLQRTSDYILRRTVLNHQEDENLTTDNTPKNISAVIKSTPERLPFPSLFDFLPHLRVNRSGLSLGYSLSKGRMGVSLIIGIPTVIRTVKNYFFNTLESLIRGMTSEEAADVLIVIFIGETKMENVLKISQDVQKRFSKHIESGLIDIIAPSRTYYPNLNNLKLTLGDPLERVKWRSKQNLDYAYLMTYSYYRGEFYLQLEDDIITKPGYVTSISNFANDMKNTSWVILDFCSLGFIGKLFKSEDLPRFIEILLMFYNDKPGDWLLDGFLTIIACRTDKMKDCPKAKSKYWISYKTSLFQHEGTHSSHPGTIRRAKDKRFGKLPEVSSNPKASVSSTMEHHGRYSLDQAYHGRSFFWATEHRVGDKIFFNFSQPISIERYYFLSGDPKHLQDKLYNTTVEVLPVDVLPKDISLNVTSDGYVIVGEFNDYGAAEGIIDERFPKISILRLHIHSDSEFWILLSEIKIEEREES